MRKLLRFPFFIRFSHWEYWNSRLVYAPLYPYYLWLSLKARSFFFLTAANPNIRNGGFIMESKKDIYEQLPSHLYPLTLHFLPGSAFPDVIQKMEYAGLQFPLIAKPDHGERGLGVKKIHNEAELIEYITKMPVAYLLQELVTHEQELGIFYYRIPGESNGRISGIVNKEVIAVTGDGKSTVDMLIRENKRYMLQWKALSIAHKGQLDEVLPKGARRVLMPYGNHCRGSKFTDVSHRISAELTKTIDDICLQLPEFYFGRLDLKFKDWQSLEMGKDISIIELNGSGSEPTHIYDPEHSIFFAWKEIIRHWNILYRISRENNRRGVPYLSLRKGRQEIRSFRTIAAQLAARNL